MRFHIREEFALKYLQPLFNSLQPILLLSIVLSVAGLLYQLWSISLTGDTRSRILIFATRSSFESFLAEFLAGYVLFTFAHGIFYEDKETGDMIALPWDEGNVSAIIRHRFSPKFSCKVRSLDFVIFVIHASCFRLISCTRTLFTNPDFRLICHERPTRRQLST